MPIGVVHHVKLQYEGYNLLWSLSPLYTLHETRKTETQRPPVSTRIPDYTI